MNILPFLIFLAVWVPNFGAKVTYENHKVYRITPKTKEAAELLHDLEENHTGFDFWTGVKAVDVPVDVMVPPHFKEEFDHLLENVAVDMNVFIEDVQDLINGERPKGVVPNRLEWSNYHGLDEINDWLRELSETDDRVTLVTGGRSYEGRDILGVKVSFAPGNEKRSVFLESNIHAREWITSAVETWILNELLTSTNQTIRALAESHDWYVFPVVNPDGFVYTHTTERLWRKTRVPYTTCYGADPNRNWDYHFNEGGTSSNACSETYRGPYAFSEPAVRTLAQYLINIGADLEAYISFHSYSQLLLIPYGYTNDQLDNYDDLYYVGSKAITSLARKYGTRYQVGNIVDVLYVASGSSLDWVKGVFKTPITYCYELRDTGTYGFVLPPNQIIPSAEETLESLVTVFLEFGKILP